jgi:hypothetical protein
MKLHRFAPAFVAVCLPVAACEPTDASSPEVVDSGSAAANDGGPTVDSAAPAPVDASTAVDAGPAATDSGTVADAGPGVYVADLTAGQNSPASPAIGKATCTAAPATDPANVRLTCTIVYSGFPNAIVKAAIGQKSAIGFNSINTMITCPATASPIACPAGDVPLSLLDSGIQMRVGVSASDIAGFDIYGFLHK